MGVVADQQYVFWRATMKVDVSDFGTSCRQQRRCERCSFGLGIQIRQPHICGGYDKSKLAPWAALQHHRAAVRTYFKTDNRYPNSVTGGTIPPTKSGGGCNFQGYRTKAAGLWLVTESHGEQAAFYLEDKIPSH